MKTNNRTETETESSSLTTVKTVYARAAVLLLALNFCLTGYVVHSLADIQQEQYGGDSEAQGQTKTYSSPSSSTQTSSSGPESQQETTTQLETREKNQ